MEQLKLLESRLAHLEKHHIYRPGPSLLKELMATRTALNALNLPDRSCMSLETSLVDILPILLRGELTLKLLF